jgi:hypothetical protein
MTTEVVATSNFKTLSENVDVRAAMRLIVDRTGARRVGAARRRSDAQRDGCDSGVV